MSSQIIVCSIPLAKLANAGRTKLKDGDWRVVAQWGLENAGKVATIEAGEKHSLLAGHPKDMVCVPSDSKGESVKGVSESDQKRYGGKTFLYIAMSNSDYPLIRVEVNNLGIPSAATGSSDTKKEFMKGATSVVEGLPICRSIANNPDSRTALVRMHVCKFNKLPQDSGAKTRAEKLETSIKKLAKAKKPSRKQRLLLEKKRKQLRTLKACIYWECGLYDLPLGSDAAVKPLSQKKGNGLIVAKKVYIAYNKSVSISTGKSNLTAHLGGGNGRKIFIGQGMAASRGELCLVLFDNENRKLKKGPPYLSCVV